MSITFPTTCSVGHDPIALNSDADLVTHHASAHPTTAISSYRSSLVSASGGPQANDPPPPPVVLRSPMASWGLTSSSFTSLQASDVSSGSELSIHLVTECISHYGASMTPSFEIDLAPFLLEFFLYCLFNAATDDASPTGSFTLRERAGSRRQLVKWSALFASFTDYFSPLGYAFTPRRLMRTCDPLFWELWNNPEVHALDRARTEGTPISRRWRLPNGKHPPAYVLVPQLFTSHLTSDEHGIRKQHQFTVTKLSQAESAPVYDGLDSEDTVFSAQLNHQRLHAQAGAARQAKQDSATRGGLGSRGAPTSDPILSTLYPSGPSTYRT